MSLESKAEELRKIRREIPQETLIAWGLPYGYDWEDEQAVILDHEDLGSGRWESYHSVIFVAPDDGKTYSADYSRGLTEYQERPLWNDDPTVTCTEVERHEKVNTVTEWRAVKESKEVKVPTLPELKARWAANRDWDEASWKEAVEW